MTEKTFLIFGLIATIACLLFFIFQWRKEKSMRAHYTVRFNNVIAADDEEKKVRLHIEAHEKKLKELTESVNKHQEFLDIHADLIRLRNETTAEKLKTESLRADYAAKHVIYSNLIKEVSIFDEKLSFAEMGVYEPHFDFTDSEQYKDQISKVREEQKRMVSNDRAVVCTKQWTVDGSQSKGQTMTNRNIKLTLRAFNNECEAAIANIRWNNANAMEKRITRAQEQIDKLNASNFIFITAEYQKLKLKELFLTHEYREKQKEEREQRAESARIAREEQKLIKDMEEAEREEDRYQKMLDKAKEESAKSVGPKLEAYTQKIEMLEKDLAEAHAKVERAQAMAEKTRSGYVYIISNVGSFGENVVKIGLTRRLDPSDRVRELGDASVPFVFDTHAIIYSDDAPALERALHTEFDTCRINAQNYRKEFFKISLESIEQAVKRLAPDASFFKDIEAQEYFETLARREAALAQNTNAQASFPSTI